MARTPQDPDEKLPALGVLEVTKVIPPTPTAVTNRRVLALQGFLPRLQEYHGTFVKVLTAIDSSEVDKWARAAQQIPNLSVRTRQASGTESARIRDVWMKYDEGE